MTAVLSMDIGGGRKISLLDGCRIAARLTKGGLFEPDSIAAWLKAIKPGATAVDIGAYCGVYAIAAAKAGASVIAFEPLPPTFDRLQENMRLNGVEIDAHMEACSDRGGYAVMNYNARIAYTSGGTLEASPKAQWEKRRVLTIRLDDLSLGNVCAIKIDVERHEPAVLRGARETIERCKPALLLEVLDDACKRGVLDNLEGYEVTAELDGRNWLLMPC